MQLFQSFLFAFAATVGFSLLFNVPRRHLPVTGFVGACGWIVYQLLIGGGETPVWSCFFGACAIALLSDICSRVLKEATTIFIIPGILPLVPGAGMYNAMLLFLKGSLPEAAEAGTQALLMAGSIAVALLIVTSIIRVLVLIKQSFMRFFYDDI